jgi:putative DNA primase/helicase
MANADRRHAATTDQFDADDWILNTPAGVVDLTTGQLRPHRQDDYCTKITNATPTPGATCPRWLAFLHRVTNGDADLIAFLQRIAGYCLTGCIRDHALFFFFGKGRNGKGTFLNVLQWAYGEYGKVAGMETLTERKQAAHSQELAVLMGARMVTAQETEEGRHWAEARIKALTGGDPITANFMRQNNFTFTPTFKLLIAGNHKPALRSVDPAMKSRMNLIPFTVEIPPAERDGGLADKLRAEGDGIMRWALEGCMEWQRIGLRPPECVRAATDEYLQSEDAIQRWMTDCLDVAPSHRNRRGDLYQNYKAWCDGSGERPLPLKRWQEGAALKGIAGIGLRHGIEWMQGARVRVAEDQPGRYQD